jgi:acetoin utilization protein AcuB
MSHLPTLKTLMTPFPYAIDIDASLAQAQELMIEHAIRHLPVTQNGQLVGVVTDRDIHRSCHKRAGERSQEALRVRDVYVDEAYVVDLNERLDTVLLQMATQHIGSALVVRHGKLAGIFTAIDACQGFGDYLRIHLPPTPDDEAA